MSSTGTGARVALALLLAINLFNYIDRQVLAAVESRIEETFFPPEDYPRNPETREPVDEWVTFWVSSLNSAFMLSYMLLAPLFGWLGDRMRRWVLIGIGVTIWSLASGASGLAPVFIILFLTRCFVGVGESAYGPVAPSVIADLYRVEERGSKMALFYAAIPVGGALGYVVGGQVMALAGGDWRWSFYVVVPPGLALGLWCFFMPEPKRGQSESVAAAPSAGSTAPPAPPQPTHAHTARWHDYWMLLKTPSYVLNTAGMTAMTFAMGGIAFYMPRYVSLDRQAGELHTVNLYFGAIVVVAGLSATILGGWVGDRLKPRYPGSYFIVSGIAMLLGFPMVLLFLWERIDFPYAWIFVFMACFCLFFNTGPTNTILANVTHPSVRASAFALNILIIHLFGDAVSPSVIALIKGHSNMTMGFLAVSAMFVIAAICWLWGAVYLERDTRLAPTRV
jgi:MFS family permease